MGLGTLFSKHTWLRRVPIKNCRHTQNFVSQIEVSHKPEGTHTSIETAVYECHKDIKKSFEMLLLVRRRCLSFSLSFSVGFFFHLVPESAPSSCSCSAHSHSFTHSFIQSFWRIVLAQTFWEFIWKMSQHMWYAVRPSKSYAMFCGVAQRRYTS